MAEKAGAKARQPADGRSLWRVVATNPDGKSEVGASEWEQAAWEQALTISGRFPVSTPLMSDDLGASYLVLLIPGRDRRSCMPGSA